MHLIVVSDESKYTKYIICYVNGYRDISIVFNIINNAK